MSNFCNLILKFFGWSIIGHVQVQNLKKSVIIVGPHTSWIDFPLGIFVRSAAKLPCMYLGKKSLFRPPLGFLFRAFGGYPVDRSHAQNQVAQVIDIFDAHESFSIALSPEGTRRKVKNFKKGFYYIARGAGAAIIMCTFDFKEKEVRFSDPFWPSQDDEKDIKKIEDHYRGIEGKVLERSFG